MKKFFVILTISLFILGNMLPVFAQIEEKQELVKVGFFPVKNFNYYSEDGSPAGYQRDYLRKISEYTGWNYEFIPVSTWAQGLNMLETGEIDILAPAHKNDKRTQIYNYSAYPMGIEYAALMGRNTDETLAYEDFDSFEGKRIGCIRNSVFVDDFKKYAEEKGLTARLVYFESQEQLLKALNEKEVDIMLDSLLWLDDNMKLLCKFYPQDVYFLVNKQKTDLLNQLDRTMESIKLEYSDFENQLIKKYFPQYKQIPFTRAEVEYIRDAPAFRIGCMDNRDPISYIDKQTGKIAGINREILDNISKISGLRFEYVPLPQQEITYDLLNKMKINMVSCVENNALNNKATGIRLSEPYLVAQKVFVGRAGEDFFFGETLKVALAQGSQTLNEMLKIYYPNFEVVKYKNTEECMKAVKSGEADILVENQYVVNQLIAKPQFTNLSVIYNKGIPDQLCLSPILYDGDEKLNEVLADDRLISIINKSIFRLNGDQIEGIIIGQTTGRPYKYTSADFFEKHKTIILSGIILALIVATACWNTFRLARKNMRLIQNSQKLLKSITNNINGGVLAVSPKKDFKLVYANEGFWALAGVSPEECTKSEKGYMSCIQEEDLMVFQKLCERVLETEEKASMELRILREKQKPIHTLVNITFAENAKGEKEIYCVIMDISQQSNMIETLEMEQERYQTVLEKSEALIFDYDTVKGRIVTSHEFNEKFGWTLPRLFWGTDLTQIWPVHAKDRQAFSEMVKEVFSGSGDGYCRARIMTMKKKYICCDINFHMIRKNGKNTRIVGTVLDVSKEMQEKEALVKKTKTDDLTGLLNKRSFKAEAETYLETDSVTAAIVFIDLDNFKNLNDSLGHLEGDLAIKDASHAIQKIFSKDAIISRFGGDEFCVMVKNAETDMLAVKAKELLHCLEHIYQNRNNTVTVTASLGIATTEICGCDFNTLLGCADKALYDTKNNGKNGFAIYGG